MSSRGKPVTRQIREQRQREAAVRQAEYDALSLQEKLDKLPPAPAAARQRAKLTGQTKRLVNADGQFVKYGTQEVKTERPQVVYGAMLPPGWVGKTAAEINALPLSPTSGDVVSHAAPVDSKKLKAKDRHAKEKK